MKERKYKMEIQEIQKLYDSGIKEFTAIMKDGSKKPFRLFVSSGGTLAYFARGKSRRGYSMWDIADEIVSIKTRNTKIVKVDCPYIEDLKKFQKTITKNLHKNLWPTLQDGYSRLNISDFETFLTASGVNKQDSYECWKVMGEYCRIHNLDIIKENRYKVTTIASNKPNHFMSEYNACIANIAKHLENKEDFHYYWEGNYDVSVSGKLCGNEYKAWFTLEYRGKGNGHYYLLINENQAIFSEDD
jgi:hypothetical protein